MPQNSKGTHLAVKIDAAMGIRKADSAIHNAINKGAKRGLSKKKKILAISKHVAALRRQLRSNTEGKRACPDVKPARPMIAV